MVRWTERMFYLWLHTAKPAWVGCQALMLHRVAMETAGYGGESARQRIWIKFCHLIIYCWLQRVRRENGNETLKQTYLVLTNLLDTTCYFGSTSYPLSEISMHFFNGLLFTSNHQAFYISMLKDYEIHTALHVSQSMYQMASMYSYINTTIVKTSDSSFTNDNSVII